MSEKGSTRDVRIRMGREDETMLKELELAYGCTSAEAIRRAIQGEVERMREGRNANRLDTLRSLILDLRERTDHIAKRVENSIEVDKGIEKALEGKLNFVHLVSTETLISVKAMIEVSQKSEEANRAIEKIRRDMEEPD